MKKFIHYIRSVVFNRRFGAGLFVLVLLFGGLWKYADYSMHTFTTAYTSYHALAAQQQNAAFLPGSAENPLRQELNQTLADVLTKETPAKGRFTLAHQGLELIVQSNAQVDMIGYIAPDVQAASDKLESAAHAWGNILHWRDMQNIVAVSKQELYTIEDIRGLSYRANFDTAEIFNRIITDKGDLTAAYTKELNSDTPAAESAFIKRQNSYVDLQKQMYDIEQAFAKITGAS